MDGGALCRLISTFEQDPEEFRINLKKDYVITQYNLSIFEIELQAISKSKIGPKTSTAK